MENIWNAALVRARVKDKRRRLSFGMDPARQTPLDVCADKTVNRGGIVCIMS